MTLKHLRAVIAFALLALALNLAPARAAVDNAICTTADAGATCSGTETITSANEEIADLRKSARMWLTSVAGTDTITATSSPVITSYQAGQCWLLKPANNNTGAVTLNIATIGAKSLLSSSGGALGSGDIQSTTIYDVCYYASNDDFRILGPLGTGFATASAAYITQASSGSLSAERVLTDGTCIDSTDGGANSTFTIAVGTCTSANLATAVTDETGSGAAVFATSPTLVTPALGTPSSATLTNATGLPISTGVSGLGTGVATALGTPSSANLRSAVTDETGTGALMFGLTTAMSDDLSCTGSQVVRRNAGDTAFECATPAGGDALTTNPLSQFAATTSAQLAGVISDETGSGAVVLGTSPTLVTPALGTPSAAVLTNATGLPLSTGVTGALGIANGGLGAAFTDPNADQIMFWDDSAAAITGITTLSGAAISGTTLTINDVTCTDCLGATEIADLVLGTDTSGNYVSGLAAGTGISVSHTPAEGSTGTYSFDFSDAGASPSLGADECRFTSNATVGGHIVCEGDTADAFESRIAITDPTADRLLTIPDADTVTVQGTTCSGTDKVSAINATTGAITCSADSGAGGGISNLVEDLTPQLGGALDTNGFGIELGTAATDTTLVRASAGVASIEGKNIALNGTSETLTTGTIELGAASDTTLSRPSAGNLAVEGNAVYRAGGTDVPLADGGTGASLTDPNANRIVYWDDAGSAAIDWLTLGTAYSISSDTLRSPTESFCVAASDETTAITTGTGKVTFHMPYAFTVTAVSASLNTVSSSGNPAIDINEDPDAEGATASASILSTTITIDANERRSSTAATAAVISDTSLGANAEMKIDIDTAGTGAKGLKVCIIGYQT